MKLLKTVLLVTCCLLGLAARHVQAFTLVESVSTQITHSTASTDGWLYGGFNGNAAAGAVTPAANPSQGAGTNASFMSGLNLPAVQNSGDMFGFLALLSPTSVEMALNPATTTAVTTNGNFVFQTEFGITEAALVTDLQTANMTALNAFMQNAQTLGYLPAVQNVGVPATASLVDFSTPTIGGTISFTILSPEPATLSLLAALAVPLLCRRNSLRSRVRTAREP